MGLSFGLSMAKDNMFFGTILILSRWRKYTKRESIWSLCYQATKEEALWLKLSFVCVCVYILPLWRLLLAARCPRHAWGVRINDLVLWIFIWVVLPSSFISFSKSIIFHLQRHNSSPSKNWRENDMIYCAPAKRWYIWI